MRRVSMGVLLRLGVYHAGTADIPPSTTRSWRLIHVESGEARKAQARATSSGVPTRPRGTLADQDSYPCGQALASPPVSMRPGETLLTRIPRGPYSRAAARACIFT